MPIIKEKRVDKVSDVFFSAASDSALKSYAKHGKIAVPMSALINVNGELELMPIHLAQEDTDIRMVDDSVEEALSPIVDYVTKTPGAKLEIIFMSARGAGAVMDRSTDEQSDVDAIINAARTESNLGRTAVYSIHKIGSEYNFEELDPGYESNGPWLNTPADFDLPGRVTQTMLASVWIHYVTLRNLASIRHA